MLRYKFSMTVTDDIILSVINQHIMGVGGLVIVADDVGGKDTVGCLKVAIAVIKANDFDVVEFLHKSHFLRFCGVKYSWLEAGVTQSRDIISSEKGFFAPSP